jgi:hypothetical protein
MAERTHTTSNSIADDIKTAVHGFTGAGDAIRGTINETIDGIFHNKQSDESIAKNRTIADHGFADMKKAEDRVEHGHGHGHQQTRVENAQAMPQGVVAGHGITHNAAGYHGHAQQSGQGSHFAGH